MPDKTACYIDGPNLYATSKSLGFDIDYRKLHAWLKNYNLMRVHYYTAVARDQEFSSIRPLLDWLDYNGFAVRTKDTKEFSDSEGRRKVKGNMDIEIAIDAMELAPRVDRVMLFSGDGDFRRLVESLQRQGVYVMVISTISTSPPMVADELRRQADEFVDLLSLRPIIGRDADDRTARTLPSSITQPSERAKT